MHKDGSYPLTAPKSQELSSTDSSRTIKTFVPPPEILHYRYMLEDPTKICNVNISDCADPDYETGKPRGHGTAIAIMAAGAKSGVAPKANLYLAKTSMTASSRETGRIEQHSVHPWAVTYTLRYIIRAIDEGLLPLGKTVLCIPFCTCNPVHKESSCPPATSTIELLPLTFSNHQQQQQPSTSATCGTSTRTGTASWPTSSRPSSSRSRGRG